MKFWDSSAIVPLLIQQPQSSTALGWYQEDDDILFWWAMPTECDSALACLERDQDITPEAATRAFERLDAIVENYHEVSPSALIRQHARRLLRTHPLRSADAQHLAAALTAADGQPKELPFVCFDARLADAARKEGFPILTAG